MEKFQMKYRIDYQSLTSDLAVTFPRLMYYIQETSIQHTESTRYKTSWFTKNRKGWVITNWSIRVSGYPILNDNIIVKTYPIQFKGVIGDRGFEAFMESGEPILAAYSTWAFADLAKNKLQRPPADMAADYGPVFPAPTEKNMDFPLFSAEDSPYHLAGYREFTATRRDTDSNEHVNNVKYIEWAFDDIPNDIYQTACTREAKINYRKQCRAGDLVTAGFYRHSRNPRSFASVFVDKDEAILAEVYTLWDENLKASQKNELDR